MASLDADKIIIPDGTPTGGVQLVKSTSVGIRMANEGTSGAGVILNLPACTDTPSVLLDGDLWVEDIDINNKSIKYYDGTNTFSVLLVKE